MTLTSPDATLESFNSPVFDTSANMVARNRCGCNRSSLCPQRCCYTGLCRRPLEIFHTPYCDHLFATVGEILSAGVGQGESEGGVVNLPTLPGWTRATSLWGILPLLLLHLFASKSQVHCIPTTSPTGRPRTAST